MASEARVLYIFCFIVLSAVMIWGGALLVGTIQERRLPEGKEVVKFLGFAVLAVVGMAILFSL